MIDKIVSGGQTGVDRAALDVGLELGIPCGGWCPQGRKAEDGAIPSRYPLWETESTRYECRTEWNVQDSDATLILTSGALEGGTALTERLAHEYGKPVLVINLDDDPDPQPVREWLHRYPIRILNVAGPRESKQAGIHNRAAEFLRELLKPYR